MPDRRAWAFLYLLPLILSARAWPQTLAAQVILVGIDGLGSEGLRAAKAPNIRRLMQRGSWTMKARGVIPTVSSPNWASMVMGATPALHGIVTNEWQPDKHDIEPVCSGMGATFPTIFGVLRQQRPHARIGVFHDWEGFARMVEPGAATTTKHLKGSAPVMAAAMQWWRTEKPALLFIHLDDVDHAGHEKGWMGPEYMAAVERIDGLIGNLVAGVAAARRDGDTAILVSADHGGTGRKHGLNNQHEIEIPWVIAGADIAVNGEIQAQVNTYDTAATIAWLLGLRMPPCWMGRPVKEALR